MNYKIYKTGFMKRILGFGKFALEVEIYGVDLYDEDHIELTYHASFDDAEDYYFEHYGRNCV